MKNNNILSIPKHILSFDNGFTPNDSEHDYKKYCTHILSREVSTSSKLFYKIIPYLIVEYNGRYLVFESNGRYSFNINGLNYIRDNVTYYDPIETIINYNADKYGIKNKKDIKCAGYIKTIRSNPDDIAIIFVAKLKESIKAPKDGKWMTLSDLINKCRKFDSFGIEYIDYLVNQKIK